MTTIRGNEAPVHPEISSLLPWYVNGSISASERQHVDEHLTLCTHCRDELARERWIYQNMTAENAVEYMPSASLQKTAGTAGWRRWGGAAPSMRSRLPQSRATGRCHGRD